MVIALPPAGRLVVLAPLAGGVVLLWWLRDQVRPSLLPAAFAVVAALYGLGLVAPLLRVDAAQYRPTLADPGGIGTDDTQHIIARYGRKTVKSPNVDAQAARAASPHGEPF